MTDRVGELRAEFDRGFAEAPVAPALEVDVLCVRLAGDPYALVLAEIAGLHADVRVVAMPSPAPELLGVASVRNAIVPVYDLGAVVGAGPGSVSRWLVVGRAVPAIAFAFAGFTSHARLPAGALPAANGSAIRGAVAIDGRLHQLVDLAAIHAALHTRWQRG